VPRPAARPAARRRRAQVTASTSRPAAWRGLGENLARPGLSAELVTADAGKWTRPRRSTFILLDAPCSGTGTCRRPSRHRLVEDEEDVGGYATQDRLLVQAIGLLTGGTLVYTVCSLQEDEGPARIDALSPATSGCGGLPVQPAEMPAWRRRSRPPAMYGPAIDVRTRRARRLLYSTRHSTGLTSIAI